MATRLKTVQYAFPVLAAAVDNTLTTFTQITVYLPESKPATPFKSVHARLSAQGTGTAQGNVTSRNLQCRLGAAGYTANSNANLYTGSGEDIHLFHEVDLTAHFNTNWSGTSMTMDAQVQIDGTWTAVAWTNLCCTVTITYEYDDTSATQVKTVYIPLNAPVGALATTQPGTATSVLPDLDADLPEASKVYRSEFITVQGNIALNGATADHTLSLKLGTTATHTSGVFEAVSANDYFFRYVWDCSAVVDETNPMDFFIWGSTAKMNHVQVWFTVTYEFDATAANDVRVSLMLSNEIPSPIGGTTSADYSRASRTLWIEEPGTITGKQVAFFPFWSQLGAVAGMNMRIGTGSFVAYTDTALNVAGSNAAMIRNDSAFTLARGHNELNVDAYRTDTSDLMWSASGFWIVNYNAGKPTQGYGAENHTVIKGLGPYFAGAAGTTANLSAQALDIPESDYFIAGSGVEMSLFSNTTGTYSGATMQVERLVAEGGNAWEQCVIDLAHTDPETGLSTMWGQTRDLFVRWPDDPDPDRMDLATAREWKLFAPLANMFFSARLYVTYHTITFTVAGTVTDYVDADGAGLTVSLHRDEPGSVRTEVVKTAVTTAGGDFTFSWYDDTEPVFVSVYEDATHVGRSAPGVAV